MSSFRILIVDDHEGTRRGLQSLLGSRPDWLVCGEARDGVEAVEKAKALRPDVILMDISMPRMNGLEATRIIRRELPESDVVIVSQNDPAIVSRQAVDVNASGYVGKMDLSRDLISTLDGIFRTRKSEGAEVLNNNFAAVRHQSEAQDTARPGNHSSALASALAPALPSPMADARDPEETIESLAWLTGSGEMVSLVRAQDWSKTPIGPVEKWSPSLRMMVSFLLANRFPLLLWWGPQYVSIYNDAYRPILGSKHPIALGLPVSECWSEIWDVLQPLIDTPYHGGPATWVDDLELEIRRSGFKEETHFTVAYSPVPDATVQGGIGGVLATVHEITDKIVSDRRVTILASLSARATEAKTAEAACTVAAEVLSAHSKDVPFALIYLIDGKNGKATLAGSAGISPGRSSSPLVVDLSEASNGKSAWPLEEVTRNEQAIVLENLKAQFAEVPAGPWSEAPHRAIILPIRSNKERDPAGVLVCGVSSQLALDSPYRSFFELVATQIATAIANARAHEEERKRAEALAEIDRAETLFFSNVSHEFRTPLTLMLGPIEDLLAHSEPDLPERAKKQLELVDRNAGRLLRLVNSLLDFSRLEAGRMEVVYQPTDLSALTLELASAFRSATDKAGLRLELNCPKLAEPVFVDRDMWEKIVLNLMSNAFKYTFEGEIEVSLFERKNAVELRVRDTGVGIAANELPRLFDRFHRVQSSRSRSHEGTGIGLALVQELVKLHGGTAGVESTPGKGSTFVVTIPRGRDHLPAGRVRGTRDLASMAVGTSPFLEEVLGWLPSSDAAAPQGEMPADLEKAPVDGHAVSGYGDGSTSGERPRVLIADDNTDMRRYLVRMLTERYDVKAVSDGQTALQEARKQAPDLILSDVMMPKLDGFALVRELRADAKTSTIPIILLSARAGEEARVEGVERGADDYLIKPFSTRELMARVQTHLELARIRKKADLTVRENERRLRLATQAAQLGIWLWYLDEDRVTWENERPYEVFGRTQAEGAVNATEFREKFIHRDDLEAFERAVSSMLQTTKPFFFQGRINRNDGSTAWVELTGQLERHADGRPWRVLGTVLDITDHRRREEVLRENEERLRLAQKSAHSGAWDLNLEKRLLVTSPELRELFGLPELDGSTPEQLWQNIIPEDLQSVDQELAKAIETHSEFCVEFRIRRPDGAIRWVESLAQILYDDGGTAVRIIGVSTDITERKTVAERERKITEEAVTANAKFRAVFEQSSVFAGITSRDGTVIDANLLSLEACGYRRDEVVGRPFWETGWWRGSREVQDKIRAGVAQAAQGNAYLEILPYLWADGTERLVEFALYPILDDQGQVIYLHPTGVDITERKQAERITGLLAAIVDSSDDAIISKNLDGMITSWNLGAERIFGYTAEEAVGQHVTLIIPPDRWDEEATILSRLKRGERLHHFETVRVRKDGTMRDISLTISPLKDSTGRFVGASKVARDVTDKKQIERALRRSEESFRAIVETTPECVKLVAVDGTLLHMNSAGLAMVGADSGEMVVGKKVYDLIVPKDRESFRAFNERICSGERGTLEFDILGLKGAARRMETHAAPLQMPDGTVVQLGVTRDITERTRAAENLRRSEEKLRTLAEDLEKQVHVRTRELEERNAEIVQQSEQLGDLSKLLLQAQDQERRHIARELHDSAGQIVTVLGINLARIFDRVRQNSPLVAKDVDDCQQLTQQLSQEIRTTSYLLYPPLLDEAGLSQALRWYIQGLSQRSGLEIALSISEDFGRLPREMELVVYRLVQECLTNVHRHSGSKNAAIRLQRDGDTVSLEIQDSGKGISPEKLNLLQLQGAGVGIRGMRERVRQFEGRMNIISKEDGTMISFLFPIPKTHSTTTQNLPQQVQAPS